MSDNKNSDANKPEEPTFSILPHPAKTNDPADLGEGYGSVVGKIAEAVGKGPHVLDEGTKANLEQPLV
ncbi:hypothetical protein FRC14_004786 [Serendipita sp. 396]|nr:hypothetical protein FRC14_004786 [Serendipita sp. 396]KAG8804566.1 hypothetical protein FRC16_006008 [Serendipita sp. 398]KAG8857396.1 hypothetical protein FRB91_011412 [Serendipita sp. 411]KAG8878687.1 hypothetical protein FRC20_006364 [Serendipita sp. 405]KAG9056222.1 hypothetical protein FS842_011321 [Serendipita sp. 407]